MDRKRVEEINKIYNSNVLAVKKEINQFIEDILDGKKDIKELSDFETFSNQAKELKEKYNSLYDTITNEEDEKKLFEFVAPEYEFLRSLMGMINILHHYHFTYSLVATLEEVQKDFEDIKTILRASFLEKKLQEATYSLVKEYTPSKNNIREKSNYYIEEFFNEFAKAIRFDEQFVEKMQNEREGKSYTPDEFYDLKTEADKIKESVSEARKNLNFKKTAYLSNEMVRVTSEKLKTQVKEALSSLDKMCKKIDLDLKKDETTEEWKKDKIIDYDFYESLSLQGKKEYLETVLSNIENSKIKVARKKFKYAGKKYNLPKIYYSRFLKYNALLTEVTKEIRIEEEQLAKELLFSENADSVISVTEQYVDLASIQKIYENQKIAKNDSVSVISILKEKLKMYKITPEMEEEYVTLFKNIEECKVKMEDMELEASTQLHKGLVSSVISANGTSVCVLSSKEEDYKKLTLEYSKLSNQMDAFVQKYEINPMYGQEQEKVREKILSKFSFWKAQNVLEVPAIQAEMEPLKKELFQLGRDKFFTFYENTKAWLRTNGVSVRLSEIYASILTAMEESPTLKKFSFTDEEKWAIFADVQAKMERIPRLLMEKGYFFISEQLSKIKSSLASLPSKGNSIVSKIKGIRKPKDKKRIHQQVKLASIGGIAIGLGVTVISGFAIASNLDKVDAKEESVRIEKETTIENNKVSIKRDGDIFNVSNSFGVSEKEESISAMLTFNTQSQNEDALSFSSSKETVNAFNTLEKQKEEEKQTAVQKNKVKEDIHIESKETVEENVSKATNVEENIVEDEAIEENLHLRWGDVVYNKPGSKVYRSFDRAAKENEPLTPYCEAESGKEITGIIYSYNGTEIFLGNDNFLYTEADLVAIENMGAVQIGYRAINKDTGIEEGYFNMSSLDTSKLEERGRGR